MRSPARSPARRALRWLGALLLVGAAVVGILAWRQLRTETVRLDDRAFVVLGGGGNTLVLAADDGALVVDTKFSYPASQLKTQVDKLVGKPAKLVINTHYHFDHSHGNPLYAGARFMAQTRTREHLLALDPGLFGPNAPGAAMLPTELVDDVRKLRFGDEEIEVRYLGRGHTDGDIVVFLRKRSLLHMGDLFTNGLYPIADVKGGGSMRDWVATIDRAIELQPKTIIPGHGPIATLDDLKAFRAYLGAVWQHALDGATAGKSCDDIAGSFDGTPWKMAPIPGFSSQSKNLETACEEAKAEVAKTK